MADRTSTVTAVIAVLRELEEKGTPVPEEISKVMIEQAVAHGGHGPISTATSKSVAGAMSSPALALNFLREQVEWLKNVRDQGDVIPHVWDTAKLGMAIRRWLIISAQVQRLKPVKDFSDKRVFHVLQSRVKSANADLLKDINGLEDNIQDMVYDVGNYLDDFEKEDDDMSVPVLVASLKEAIEHGVIM